MVTSTLTTNHPGHAYLQYPDDGFSNTSTGWAGDSYSAAVDTTNIFLFRFQDFPVVPGSTIQSAYLQVQFYQKTATTAATEYFNVRMEKVADSAPFTTNVMEHNRTKTTANVNWTANWNTSGASPQYISSPNLSSLISEVIAVPGYQRLNSVTIIATPTQAGGGLDLEFPEDGGFGSPAVYVTLTVNWTPPAGVTTGPPSAPTITNFTNKVMWEYYGPEVHFTFTDPDNDAPEYAQVYWRKVGTVDWSAGMAMGVEEVSSGTYKTQILSSSGLDPVQYEVQVRVYAGAWSPFSSISTFKVHGRPAAPTGLVPLSASTSGPISPTWTYNDPDGNSQIGFKIKWRPVL